MQEFSALPPLNEDQFYLGRRLLVYQREYLVLEKDFADFQGLQDWLAVNTSLSSYALSVLFSQGHLLCGEGMDNEFLQLEHRRRMRLH